MKQMTSEKNRYSTRELTGGILFIGNCLLSMADSIYPKDILPTEPMSKAIITGLIFVCSMILLYPALKRDWHKIFGDKTH